MIKVTGEGEEAALDRIVRKGSFEKVKIELKIDEKKEPVI